MGVGSSHEPTSNSCSSSSLVNLRSFRDHSYKDLAGAAGQRGGLGIADDIAIGNTSGGSGMLNTSRDKKKQRLPNFNSFKKRIVKHKKAATAADHSKQFYEYFASKSTSVLSSMLEHYEADLARPPAHTLKQNLESLFVRSYCPDFKLLYLDTVFHVHKSILWTRCPYFKEMLLVAGAPSSELVVRLQTPGVDVPMFSSLLRFLYTGEYPSQEMSPRQIDILISLARECGVPNLLEVDLEHLYLSCEYTDCILVFTQDKTKKCDGSTLHNTASTSTNKLSESSTSSSSFIGAQATASCHIEISCHKALLCARSPFFRNLILRRLQSADADGNATGANSKGPALTTATSVGVVASIQAPNVPEPMKLVLDESVIPMKYAKVLAHALYVDTIDFDLVVDDKHAESVDRVKDAMELYQIGRFLDLDIMAQNCEDAIVQRLNETNVVEVLEWSGQPHGSAWVHRQTMQYLLEDFVHVTSSASLECISKETLKAIISSDFVQASETDILKAVIKWGELIVARRGETAAAAAALALGASASGLIAVGNASSSGASGSSNSRSQLLSSSTGGGRHRQRQRNIGICDREVAEVVHDLMSCVRLENILGESDVVRQAIERGLLTRPKYKSNSAAYGRSCEYMIGCDTAGAADLFGSLGHLHFRPRLFIPHYEQCKLLHSEKTSDMSTDANSFNFHSMTTDMPDALYMVNKPRGVCFSSRTHNHQPILPDNDNIEQMVARIHKLYQSKAVQRALGSSLADHHQFMLQLELRVVREFNLPDTFVSVLQNALEGGSVMYDQDDDKDNYDSYPRCGSSGGTLQMSSGCCTPCSSSQQRESIIPDIAMASSSMSSLCLSQQHKAISISSPWISGAGSSSSRCMYSKSFKPSPDLVVGTVSAAFTGATGGGYGAVGGGSSTCTVDTVMSSSLTMYSSHDLSGLRQEHKHQGSRGMPGSGDGVMRRHASAQLDDIPTGANLHMGQISPGGHNPMRIQAHNQNQKHRHHPHRFC